MTKNENENESSHADLDFYDFVEVIADKIDFLSQQSKEEKYMFICFLNTSLFFS